NAILETNCLLPINPGLSGIKLHYAGGVERLYTAAERLNVSFVQVPVLDLFWPVSLAPGLDQLITATDRLYNWLYNDEQHAGATTTAPIPSNNRVAVIHCSGPINLISVYIAALLCICRVKAHE
ncbi:Tensin 1, partial [Cichlidogyrus casuarinus]